MGPAPWLIIGGEEEREIKDETQIPRKNVWCAILRINSSTRGGYGLGKKMLKIVLSLRYLSTTWLSSKSQLVYGAKAQERNIS